MSFLVLKKLLNFLKLHENYVPAPNLVTDCYQVKLQVCSVITSAYFLVLKLNFLLSVEFAHFEGEKGAESWQLIQLNSSMQSVLFIRK